MTPTAQRIYIIVRLDIAGSADRDILPEDTRRIVEELDYSFTGNTEGYVITDTEICGIDE